MYTYSPYGDGEYLIEVRRLGPKYTYYLRSRSEARPFTPSTGFFDSAEDALQAALTKAAQLHCEDA
ncbi:hypothetical protein SAMN05414139_08960 [Burkholderia sp. D7]|nr:hypothetical protein SAMN05414139_08960 [Burkholderia sp. D7]